MTLLEKRRVLVSVGGGVLALLLALGLALFIKSRDHPSTAPPPASTGGLVVQTGALDDGKIDPAKPLRCFVGGQFIGMETLSDCARKNGVATQALDVGVDQTGALAGGAAGAGLTPLPPSSTGAADQSASEAAMTQTQAPAAAVQHPQQLGDCLRYGAGAWRKLGSGLTLSACVQALYSGHCAGTGEADYGRWADQTLRLIPHKVEMSADNHSFRTVVEQFDDSCVIPQF